MKTALLLFQKTNSKKTDPGKDDLSLWEIVR